jgi:hypothetical protein
MSDRTWSVSESGGRSAPHELSQPAGPPNRRCESEQEPRSNGGRLLWVRTTLRILNGIESLRRRRLESIRTSDSTARFSSGYSKGAQTAVKKTKMTLSHSTVPSVASSGFKVKVRRGQMSRMRYGTSMESRTQVECVTTMLSPLFLDEVTIKVTRTAAYT